MPTTVDPGQVISLAQASTPQAFGTPMNADYARLVADLLGLLQTRQIPFVVVGGIALLQHVRGRNTDDIAFILSAPRLADLPELSIIERLEMFACGNYHHLRVDLLFAEHPFFRLIENEFSQPMPYALGPLPTATLDGLILLKRFALPSLYRQFDFDRVTIYESDITQLLARSSMDDDFFLATLSKYILPSEIDELRALLKDVRARINRTRTD